MMAINQAKSGQKRGQKRTWIQIWMRGAISVCLAGAMTLQAGCAYIVEGSTQEVQIVTDPAGENFYFEGKRYTDGDTLRVKREYRVPEIAFGERGFGEKIELSYVPNSWLAGNGGLLIFAFVPGLVAFGGDFYLGTWRDLHERQLVHVPTTSPVFRAPLATPPAVQFEAASSEVAEADLLTAEQNLGHPVLP